MSKSKFELTVIDIGAWGGVSSEWESIGDYTNIIGFEPDKKECKRLNKLKNDKISSQKFYPLAVAGGLGSRNFYVTRRATVASLVRPNQKAWKLYGIPGSERNRRAEVKKIIKVSTTTLDNFCDKENIKPDFLKIDTQGSELEIIKEGFSKNIKNLIGIEIEVEFIPLYKDQPLFSEIEQYLRQHDFELFGLKRHMWKMHNGTTVTKKSGGRITFADALFFNKKIFQKNTDTYAIKAALLAYRHGLNDLVEYILERNDIHSKFKQLVKKDKKGIIKKLKTKVRNQYIVNFDKHYGF